MHGSSYKYTDYGHMGVNYYTSGTIAVWVKHWNAKDSYKQEIRIIIKLFSQFTNSHMQSVSKVCL